MIKAKDLRSMNEKELNEKMLEVQAQIMKLTAQNKTGAAVKNTAELRNSKKTIAKIKTVLNETNKK